MIPSARKIPQRLQEDDALQRKFKVALAEALARRLGESDWKKLAVEYGLERRITEHDRFLRSARFDDPDFEGHVLDLVDHVFDHRPEVVIDLFERASVQQWFKANGREFLAVWEDQPDPILQAVAHGVAEVEAVSRIIDLTQYTRRIQAALPDDPNLAIGVTKDMLEATMRTILSRRSIDNLQDLDFQQLSSRCFHELGLTPQSQPASAGERHVRKVANSAKAMVEAANTLRNLAGAGHGRVVGEEEQITADDASLVASSALVVAAWLARRAEVA